MPKKLETKPVVEASEDSTVAVEAAPVQPAATEVQPKLTLNDHVTRIADEFVAWAKGGEREDLSEFVMANLLREDNSLADDGQALLDAEGIAWATVNFLELGVPVTFVLEGKKYEVKAGSTFRVMHGGYDNSLASRFWDCYAGERLPHTRIYQHRLHKFYSANYPIMQKLKTTYLTSE